MGYSLASEKTCHLLHLVWYPCCSVVGFAVVDDTYDAVVGDVVGRKDVETPCLGS